MAEECHKNGLRFGVGQPACGRTDTQRYNAGCYGSAWLCPDHAHIARLLVDDANAAERENGAALAQMARDERAMMRDA
jgi:hypothetical protein